MEEIFVKYPLEVAGIISMAKKMNWDGVSDISPIVEAWFKDCTDANNAMIADQEQAVRILKKHL